VRPRRELWAICLSVTAVILGLSATVVSGLVFLDVGTVATIIGDVLAATAVIFAASELRRAKRSEERARLEAAEERRRVFEAEQLVAFAEVIGDFGKSPTWLEEIRIRLLPAWMLPVARRWVDDWEGLYNWFVAELLPEHPEGYDFGEWVRRTTQIEIRYALDVLVGISDANKMTSRSAGWINQPPWQRVHR
jgi:hypothetical protein